VKKCIFLFYILFVFGIFAYGEEVYSTGKVKSIFGAAIKDAPHGRIISYIRKGGILKIIGEEGDYYKVVLEFGKGFGYVLKQNIKIIKTYKVSGKRAVPVRKKGVITPRQIKKKIVKPQSRISSNISQPSTNIFKAFSQRHKVAKGKSVSGVRQNISNNTSIKSIGRIIKRIKRKAIGKIRKIGSKIKKPFKNKNISFKKQKGIVMTGGDRLNVRVSPWGTIIGKLHDGDEVEIIGKEGDWYKIEYNGSEAYVHGAYVSIGERGTTDGSGSPADSSAGSGFRPEPGSWHKGVGRKGLPEDGIASFRNLGPLAKYALEWSRLQMNPKTGTGVNRNNGKCVKDDVTAWDSWCLAFVATAYQRKVSLLAAPDAISSYKKFLAAGKINTSRNVPPGAPVFFEATRHNSYFGHIAIATGFFDGNGSPIVRTSGWRGNSGIWETSLSNLEAITGKYLGYGIIDE